MIDYYIPNGFITKGVQKAGLSLKKVFKDLLRSLKVPFVDECCPAETIGFTQDEIDNFQNVPTGFQIYNLTTNTLQYFDGFAWQDINGGAGDPPTLSNNETFSI